MKRMHIFSWQKVFAVAVIVVEFHSDDVQVQEVSATCEVYCKNAPQKYAARNFYYSNVNFGNHST